MESMPLRLGQPSIGLNTVSTRIKYVSATALGEVPENLTLILITSLKWYLVLAAMFTLNNIFPLQQ